MPHCILILDDDHQVRNSLAIHLEDEDFAVHEAITAEEAFDLLEEHKVDLVVVDLRLPGMDGADFIHEAWAKWPDMKFIIYTGSPEFSVPIELTTLPCVADSIFFKPLSDPEAMVDQIRDLLDSRTG